PVQRALCRLYLPRGGVGRRPTTALFPPGGSEGRRPSEILFFPPLAERREGNSGEASPPRTRGGVRGRGHRVTPVTVSPSHLFAEAEAGWYTVHALLVACRRWGESPEELPDSQPAQAEGRPAKQQAGARRRQRRRDARRQ